MLRFTLTQIFGDAAYQDSQQLVIPLAGLGLGANASAQSIFIAILSRCICNGLVTTNDSEYIIVAGEPLDYNNSLLYQALNVIYTRNQIRNKEGISYYSSIFKVLIFTLDNGAGLIPLDINQI
jgi:hypothetical protein